MTCVSNWYSLSHTTTVLFCLFLLSLLVSIDSSMDSLPTWMLVFAPLGACVGASVGGMLVGAVVGEGGTGPLVLVVPVSVALLELVGSGSGLSGVANRLPWVRIVVLLSWWVHPSSPDSSMLYPEAPSLLLPGYEDEMDTNWKRAPSLRAAE